MKEPFREEREERRFGPSTNMFKSFFGNDFFGDDDDDFFGFNNKMNQTQRFDDYPSYNYPPQQKPQSKNVININTNDNNNIKEPKDNLSRSMNPNLYSKNPNKRPQTAKKAIYVPSRKHKYIKKDNQNSNEKYNPFQKRDSTDLIIIPGTEKEKEKIKQKTKEIPLEFHKQATGLGQIADTINENEDESMSDDGSNSSEELDRIAREKEKQREEEQKNKEMEKNKNKFYDGSEATFENSIRNKYKRKKTEEMEKLQNNENKLRSTPKYNNNINNNNQSGRKNDGYNKRNSKKMNIEKENNGQFNMKNYARRLSKMNISSTNWNINQLGDMLTYPDVTEIEA